MTSPFFTKLKSIILTLVLTITASQLFAQNSNGIFFQAVARDNYANAAKDRKIFVQTSVIQNSITGTKVLTEDHQANTDASGVFSITIGNGTRIGGIAANLSGIDWSKGPFFLNLKVSITPIGGNANWDYTKEWVDMGTTSFGAVPFSFYAATVAGFDTKLNVSDSAKMLSSYAKTTAINTLTTSVDTKLLTKLNIADSTKYVTPTQLAAKTFDQIPITNSIASKLNIADSTKYVTPTQLAAKTFDQTPITNSIASKLNIADSTKYVTPTQLAAKTFDTSSISNRINLKANDADMTTALSLKANASDVTSSLLLKLDANQKGTPNGLATLNSSGIIPSSQLPPVSLSSTSVVSSDADMIALSSAIVGSIAVRTDVNKNFVLSALPASILNNWVELLTPAAPVQTVNGYIGSVNLTKTDVDLSNVNNTADIDKPLSSATQNALALKANVTSVDAAMAQKLSIVDANTAMAQKLSIVDANTALALKLSISDANAASSLKLDASKLGVASGAASLDASGKIPSDQIPAISFSSVKVLNSQSEMLALSNALVGSVVIRTDLNKNYVLASANPTILANWVELLTPAPPVQTVNGMTGSVAITKTSIDLGNVNNTSDVNKPVSAATQTALDAKADNTSVQSALALKSNITDVNTALALKSNSTDVNTALALKSNSTDVNTALALKAPLASPTFTGTVTTSSINTGALISSSVKAPTFASTPITLSYTGSTINWNPSLGLNAAVTLTQNSTISFTTPPPVGSYGTVILTQDATGSRTILLPTISGVTNKVLGSTSTITVALSTAATTKDILNFYYDGINCYWNVGQGYGIAATSNATNLATNVTGTLAVANGGTGAVTLTGIIKGTGSSALSAAVSGTDFQAPIILTTTGSGAATLSGTTLNIPSTTNYTLPTASALTLGGVKVGTNLSIDVSGVLSANINAGSISGTISLTNGGTGATTAAASLTNLGAASIASPTFTGTPSLPSGTTGVTQTAGNNTTALATTSFVTTAIAAAVRLNSDEYNAIAGQTSFTLSQTPLGAKVWMFVNGTRIKNGGYSISGNTVTYNPSNNNSYALIVSDRIQFDYAY